MRSIAPTAARVQTPTVASDQDNWWPYDQPFDPYEPLDPVRAMERRNIVLVLPYDRTEPVGIRFDYKRPKAFTSHADFENWNNLASKRCLDLMDDLELGTLTVEEVPSGMLDLHPNVTPNHLRQMKNEMQLGACGVYLVDVVAPPYIPPPHIA